MKSVFYIILLVIIISCKEDKIEVKLNAFESSECKKEIDYDLQGNITKDFYENGNLKLSIYGVANCCSDFNPIFIVKNDTIDIGFKEFGRVCDCSCCYDFIYEISGIKNITEYHINFINSIIEIVETEIAPESSISE